MIRAILEGRKTQTRRLVKDINPTLLAKGLGPGHIEEIIRRCPHGKPGDKLWCRESFSHYGNQHENGTDYALVQYRADNLCADIDLSMWWDDQSPLPTEKWWNKFPEHKFKPSIFMPLWASRITLEIKNVRVERVQDISEEEAVAEGVYKNDHGNFQDYEAKPEMAWFGSARESFATLWRSINGPGAWERNDWVWVIKFKVV